MLKLKEKVSPFGLKDLMRKNSPIQLSELQKKESELRLVEKMKRIQGEVQIILDREGVDIQASMQITPFGIYPTFGLIEKKQDNQ